MTGDQTIVDRIEQALASLDAVSNEELHQLAEEYAEACEQVNRRLQEIHHLIRSGARSEAIRRAEIPPKLLDVVEILDFPDRDAWVDICTLERLPTPPRLLVQYLSELHQAYEAEQGLSGLLRQHRALAMAQAPLHKRLAILRQLARAEPENPVWQKDIRILENYWLDKLQREIQERLKAEDLQTLEEILEQLESNEWLEKPSVSLVEQCRSAVASLRGKIFRQEMENIARLVNQALANGDMVRMEEYLRLWDHQAATNPQWVDIQLREQVAEAMSRRHQLEREREEARRRRELLTEFEALLGKSHDLHTLEHHYAELAIRGVAIPEPLEERYRRVTETLRQRAMFRRVVTVAGVAAVVIATLLIVWQVQARMVENRRLSDAVSVVEDLLEKDKLDEAAKYLADFKAAYPTLAQHRHVISLEQKLADAQAAEAKRRETLASLLEKVRASLAQVPDGVSLQKASELARTDAEKQEVMELESQAKVIWANLRQQAEERLRQEIAKLSREYDALRQRGSVSIDEELQAIARLMNRLTVLSDDNRRQGLSLEGEIRNLREQLSSRFLEVSQASEEEKLIRTMCSAAARGPEAYQEAIKKLEPAKSVRIPIGDFQLVEQEFPCWKVIAEWNRVATLWNDPTTSVSDAGAQELFRGAFRLVQVVPPEASAFVQEGQKRILALLDTIARRELLVADRLTVLVKEWRAPLVADTWQIRLNDGRRYYCLEQPGRTALVLRDLANRQINELTFPRQSVVSTGRAPQSVLANQVRDHLADWSASNWETTADTVLGKIIGFCHTVEKDTVEWPLIFHLLYETWSAAKEGDVAWAALWNGYQAKLQPLRDRYPPHYDWIKTAQAAENQYEDIRSVLGSLPTAEDLLSQVKQVRATYRGRRWPTIDLVGLLFEDKTQVWYVRTVGQPAVPDGAVLYVVEQGPEEGQVTLRRIGHWSNSRAVVEPQQSVRFYNGRHVVTLAGEEPGS